MNVFLSCLNIISIKIRKITTRIHENHADASDNLYCLYDDTDLISSVDVGPASMLVGNLVAGKRIAQAIGRELGVVEDQDLIRKVLFLTNYDTALRSSDPITLDRSFARTLQIKQTKKREYCLDIHDHKKRSNINRHSFLADRSE